MNLSYSLGYPKSVIFGNGSISQLPGELPPDSTVLLVTGRSAERGSLRNRLMALLHSFNVTQVSGVSPEPPLEEVDSLVEHGREIGATAVVAVGGGSVIDAAKAAAAIIPAGGRTYDFFSGARELKGKGLLFLAAPTTAGTGADLTANSVLTDPSTKVKKSLRHRGMTPDVSIVDPELTLSCPPALTAASGLDAFIQALESYTSPKGSAPTRQLALAAASKTFRKLPDAFERPDDLAARTEMAEGSLLSAMAFSQTGLGAIHGLAHPLGSLLGVPHGVICSIVMPHVLEWNLPVCRKDYADLAFACSLSSAESFIEEASALAAAMGIPKSLSKYGLSQTHFPFIVKNCRSASMSANPRPMDDSNVETLLRKLM